MATTSVPVPRRGTPAFRAWTVRALVIGVLPMLAAVVGALTLRVFDLAAATREAPWTDLTGWMLAGGILLGVIAFVALFDRRTRLSGAVALAVSLILNPLASSLILQFLGVAQ